MKINALLIAVFLRLSTVRSNTEPTDIFLADAMCPPVIGDDVCYPDCYCIPDDLTDCGTCPDIGSRKILGSFGNETTEFFSGLSAVNSSLFRLDPEGCNPFPMVSNATSQPLCVGVKTKKGKKSKKSKGEGEALCSFRFKKSKSGEANDCYTNEYSIVEQRVSKKSKKSKKGFVTHEGSCGVCSSAQDLVANLSPTLDEASFNCTQKGVQLFTDGSYEEYFEHLVKCIAKLGFSQDCTAVWASSSFNTVLNIGWARNATEYKGPKSCITCATACLGNPTPAEWCNGSMTPGTCDLNPCVQCDEDVSGEIFKLFAGRTRRNSGVVTVTDSFTGPKRPCSTIANVSQTMPPQCEP